MGEACDGKRTKKRLGQPHRHVTTNSACRTIVTLSLYRAEFWIFSSIFSLSYLQRGEDVRGCDADGGRGAATVARAAQIWRQKHFKCNV
jgi:hypothetical protein